MRHQDPDAMELTHDKTRAHASFKFKIGTRSLGSETYVPRDVSRHERFILSPSKSFFKKLIVSTPLRHHLKIMLEAESVPKGLKDQEVERGSIKKRPPIPYVPVVDEVQDALNKSKGVRRALILLSCMTRQSS